MGQGRKNEGLASSHQLQVPVPTSHPVRLIVGTHRVRSMGKVNAVDRIQIYRYVLIPSLLACRPALAVSSGWEEVSLHGRMNANSMPT